MQGGVCFYTTYGENASQYSVLVTTHPDVTLAGHPNEVSPCKVGNTVVIVNKTRQPKPYEPCFPDGLVLETLDMIIPRRTRWLNNSWETFYRGHYDHAPRQTAATTYLQPGNDGVLRLHGNIGKNFQPQPAADTEEVESDAEALWRAWSALLLCGPAALEEGITALQVVPVPRRRK